MQTSQLRLRMLEMEMTLLQRVRHAHIIRLDALFAVGATVYLVFELCTRGTLQQILDDAAGVVPPLPQTHTPVVVRQLADAVAYLHDQGSHMHAFDSVLFCLGAETRSPLQALPIATLSQKTCCWRTILRSPSRCSSR
jgi:serine/threonine protein kinase